MTPDQRLAELEARLAESKMFNQVARMLLAHAVTWMDHNQPRDMSGQVDKVSDARRAELVANIKAQLRARG